MAHLIPRGLAIVAVAGLWVLAAALLWRTRVPADLELPRIDPVAEFGGAHLRRTAEYERFLRVVWALGTLVQLAALGLLALRAPSLGSRLPGGRLRRGVLLGLAALLLLWLVRLPFGLAAHWWRRRHDVARLDYLSWLVDPWPQLLAELAVTAVVVTAAMLLAGRLGRRWWLAGGPALVAVAAVVVVLQPLVLRPKVSPLRDGALEAQVQALAQATGVGRVEVEVREAARRTRAANAEVYGIGPTRRVVLWDTLIDGSFLPGEVRTVVAHELAHVGRDHVWKGLAWLALFALPGTYVLERATRRRGGLAQPEAIPLGALVIVALQLALLPATNAVSRRYEAEADWLALEAARDPDAAVRLFHRFSERSLADPDPPRSAVVLLRTHPPLVDRIALARAWDTPSNRLLLSPERRR